MRVSPGWILAALLAIALALRLIAIGDRLSNDEGYTWLVVSAHGPGVFLDRLAAFENTPPLFYLLTWPLPDAGVAWLRIVAVLAGVGCVWATYWAAKVSSAVYSAPQVTLAAVFAAGAVAVAPFAVSYSDYARGFVLADALLILALGAALRRRWWLYAVAATAAVYTEYDSALFLVALSAAVGWREWRAGSRRRAWRSALALAAPIATLAAWLPEALRDSATKVSPVYPSPSPDSLRDLVVRLTFGEHGTAHAASVRWLQFVVVAAVCVWAFRKAPRTIAVTAAGTLILHAIAAWIGPDIFAPRYLTELIPLAAIALGHALAGWAADRAGGDGTRALRARADRASADRARALRARAAGARRAVPVAVAVVLALVAVAVAIRRAHGNDEPDIAGIGRLVAPAARGRTVITNSAVVAYYLRGLHPRLDRPFGLGPGLEARCGTHCKVGFLVVDDTRVAGGIRTGPGQAHQFGPIYVRATPQVGGRATVLPAGR